MGCVLASEPIRITEPIRFGSYFELDLRAYELRRAGKALKLERIPMELLVLLVERKGELVSRDQIVESIWGKDVFLDTDNSINAAIRKIRQVLKDDPERPSFVVTVTGKGYRFVAPVEEPRHAPPELSVGAPQLQQPPADNLLGKKFSHYRLIQLLGGGGMGTRTPNRLKQLLAAVFVLALVAATFVVYQIESRRAKQPAIRSLAVLPLQNLSDDPAQQYLADGITEELIGRLAGIRDLRVISRTSVMRFKSTQLSVPEIARMLGVDAVVEGSVIREGSRIRVRAQLIRATSDEHFWSESYDRELRDVLAMDADVAQAIANKVEVTMSGEEHRRLAAVRYVLPEVYENYLKGKYALAKGNNKANIEESITYFNQAIRKDPTFAPGYSGLAKAYWDLGSVFMGGVAEQERPRAVVAAQKALELDPDLAEAHVLMALIAETQWHWAEAEGEYRRALGLRPNDAAAYSGLAWWLDCQGNTEEAVTMRRHARELDPLAISGADLGWDLLFARRYDQAIQELHSVLAVRPDDAFARWILGFALIANHDPQGAIPELERGISVSNRSPAVIGLLVNAYAQAGRRRDALRLLDELKRRRQTEYVPAAAFVFAYLGLGNYDQTFVWLDQAYKEQSYALQTLKVLPLFDPIRSDPRFIDLLHRVGLDRPS